MIKGWAGRVFATLLITTVFVSGGITTAQETADVVCDTTPEEVVPGDTLIDVPVIDICEGPVLAEDDTEESDPDLKGVPNPETVAGNEELVAPPQTGVLGASTESTPTAVLGDSTTDPAVLAETGNSSVPQVVSGVLVVMLSTAIFLLSRQRRSDD